MSVAILRRRSLPERIGSFEEFHTPLPLQERRRAGGPLHELRRALLPERRGAGRHGVRAARCTT